MKIASAQLQMSASHSSTQRHEVRESTQMWVGQRRPGSEPQVRQPAANSSLVTLSDAAKQGSQSAEAINSEVDAAVDNDPMLNLIRSMLEYLTGKKIHTFDSSQLHGSSGSASASTTPAASSSPATTAAPAAGYGVAYDYHESYSETEQTSFSATGSVQTADGRSINFNLELSMSRSYYEESNVSIRLGDAARQVDPLVLNFAGNAAQLTDQRFAFDLNSDGSTEQINFVAPGSGFLVFDRNHDGVINNGKEMFGPSSGNGFSELAALDDDKNGWIDENDAAFGQLQVWTRNTDAKGQLLSLSQAGVGAIALATVATPFSLKNDSNELLGKIRSSGIFLQEDGSAGTIQQIDLTA